MTERSQLDRNFGAPILLQTLSTAENENSPRLPATKLVVVFASDRPGGAGKKGLWYSTRARVDAQFSAPRPVPAPNSTADDEEPALSADGCELFFTSGRPPAASSTDERRMYRVSVIE